MELIVTPDAQRQIMALPRMIQARMDRVFERLEYWPNVSGAKPLRHGLKGRYRIRTGDYRVQFHLHEGRIVIEKVGHRDGFYGE